MHPGPQVQLIGKGHMVHSLGHSKWVPVQLHGDDVATQVPLGALAALRIPAASQVQKCVSDSPLRRHNGGFVIVFLKSLLVVWTLGCSRNC